MPPKKPHSSKTKAGKAKPMKGAKRGPPQRKKIRSELDVYSVAEKEEKRAQGYDKYDRDAEANYEYQLPDNFDDEEIDEDDAFGPEDYELYGNIGGGSSNPSKSSDKSKSKAKGGKGKNKKYEESEDEEESLDEEDEEGLSDLEEGATMDLSEMLEDAAPGEVESKEEKSVRAKISQLERALQPKRLLEDEDDEDRDDDEELSAEDDDDDDDDDEHVKLLSVISNIQNDLLGDEGKGKGTKRKRGLTEKNEALDESEFNLQSTRDLLALGSDDDADGADGDEDGANGPIRLGDLLGSLGDGDEEISSSAELRAMKKQLAALKKGKVSRTLQEPMEEVYQERSTRQVGYEQAKEKIERWQPLVKRSQEAEFLHFPLNEPPRANLSSASLQVKFTPSNSIENDFASLLEQFKLREKDLVKSEESQLAQQEFTKEEILARQEKLAKLRNLMFYDELKRRRQNKIKSKSYRRLKKKQREAAKMTLEEMEQLDPAMAQEEREKMERARAEERLTLQHKNTGKWAKQQLKRKGLKNDANTKEAMQEQLRMSQALRQKMKSAASSSEDEDEDNDDYEISDDDTAAVNANVAKSRAQEIRESLAELEEEEKEKSADSKSKKGLFALKFMQRADERRKVEAERLLKELEMEEAEQADFEDRNSQFVDPTDLEKKQKDRARQSAATIPELAMRRSFGPKLTGKGNKNQYDDEDDVDVDAGEVASALQMLKNQASSHTIGVDGALTVGSIPAPKKSSGLFEEDTTSNSILNQPIDLKKMASITKKQDPQARFQSDSASSSSSSPASTSASASSASSSAKSAKPAKAQAKAAEINEDDDEDDEEDEAENPWASAASLNARRSKRQDVKASKSKSGDEPQLDLSAPLLIAPSSDSFDLLNGDENQERLVQAAFAGAEDEEENFAKEKAEEVAKELPKVELSSGLPGWGAWAGDGIQARKKSERELKNEKRKLAALQAKAKAVADARADAGLKNVLINEKKDKKALKYLVPRLPYPFTSVEQYERHQRNPLGPEWNTLGSHQTLTKPNIVTKQGAIIQPAVFNPNVGKKKKAAASKKGGKK